MVFFKFVVKYWLVNYGLYELVVLKKLMLYFSVFLIILILFLGLVYGFYVLGFVNCMML